MGPSYEMPSVLTMRWLATAAMAGIAVARPPMRPAGFARQWVHMKSWDTFLDLRHVIVAMVARPRKSRLHRFGDQPLLVTACVRSFDESSCEWQASYIDQRRVWHARVT